MIHGLLLSDKPTAMTSHDLVDRVRRRIGQREVGHAGTLDPLATGLMVLLLGEATKLSDYVLNDHKSYEVKVRLGLETDSWDIDGEVVNSSPIQANTEQVREKLPSLEGELELPVPMFSAVKRGGKKLYELAREKQEVELPLRKMEFWDVKLLSVSESDVLCSLSCTKGSFIRSWAMELGRRLNTTGTVGQLRRVQSGPFNLRSALTLEQIQQLDLQKMQGHPAFIPFGECLPDWPAVRVAGKERRLIENGQVPFDLARRLIVLQKAANAKKASIGLRILEGASNELLALVEIAPNRPARVKRVFKHLAAGI